MSLTSAGRLTAVLGPTNTGKTYLAIERMLGHESGMIGFPLRLLARENYDRIVRVKGASQVALITGEERIAPASARYFVCTVESMPLDRQVDLRVVFVAAEARQRFPAEEHPQPARAEKLVDSPAQRLGADARRHRRPRRSLGQPWASCRP